MSKQTDASFLIVSSVPALYQRLLSGAANYQEVATRVLRQIKVAHTFRQVERVRELAKFLLNIPIKEFQLIAQYYLVWCKCRELEYHPEILERVAEQSQTYKAQALISRAALEVYQGNVEPALYFYTEALKAHPSVSDFIHASVGIAIVKSMEGFNALALDDLESLTPLLHYAEPLVHFTATNAYAVELNAVGRLTEAQAISASVMGSPLTPFYPESRETLIEITSKRKRSSTIAFTGQRFERYEPEIETPKISQARVQAAIEFMNANFHSKITLDDFTEVVNISADRFTRIFKIETGVTIFDYLIRLRLGKASELLKTSFLSVKEVMVAVGYKSKSLFSRHFKRQFGATPSEYRSRFFYRG